MRKAIIIFILFPSAITNISCTRVLRTDYFIQEKIIYDQPKQKMEFTYE
jgi:hypothetical protein